MRSIPHALFAGAALLGGSLPALAGDSPAANCCQPAPLVVTPPAKPRGVLAPAHASADQPESLDALYRAWAKASADLEPLGGLDRRRIECAAPAGCTAHELSIVCEFHGPVQADDLRRRYDCARIEKRGPAVRLTLTPTDPVERMFVPECVVTLETATHRPTRIEFPADAARKTPCVVPIVARANIDRLIALSDAPPEACGVPGPLVPIETAQLVPGVEEVPRPLRPVTPEVKRMLAHWEQATTGRELRAEVRRFTYDLVFHTERRSSGEFRYEAPGAGRLELHPLPVGAHADSPRQSADGKPFQLVADHDETWFSREPALLPVSHEAEELPRAGLAIRHADGSSLVLPVKGGVEQASADGEAAPPPGWFPHRILPLVVDVRAEQLPRDFAIECVHETPDQAWLRFEPQSGAARSGGFTVIPRFREITVILDKHRWLPVATRGLDAAGSTEVVHTFNHWTVSELPAVDALPLVPPAPAPPLDDAK